MTTLNNSLPPLGAERTTPLTRLEVLQQIAALCTEGLPVPMHIDLTEHSAGDIWVDLRLHSSSKVDAWAGRLGMVADFDGEPLQTGGRWWRKYDVDVWDEAAAAAWGPGISRMNLWCSVDEAGRSS